MKVLAWCGVAAAAVALTIGSLLEDDGDPGRFDFSGWREIASYAVVPVLGVGLVWMGREWLRLRQAASDAAHSEVDEIAVGVDDRAAAEIRARGGDAFVWARPYGGGFLRLEVDVRRPAGETFVACLERDGYRIHVSAPVAQVAEGLRPTVKLRRWPRRRLWVTNPSGEPTPAGP